MWNASDVLVTVGIYIVPSWERDPRVMSRGAQYPVADELRFGHCIGHCTGIAIKVSMYRYRSPRLIITNTIHLGSRQLPVNETQKS